MVRIGKREIGQHMPPFIVAELSCNHQKSLDKAFLMIDKAKAAGVDAIKLQTFTPQGMTLPIDAPDFTIQNPQSPWYQKRLYDLYTEAYTPWEWHALLFEYCKKKDLLCFSSPFEIEAVDFLEKHQVPCYKIASFELVDIPLLLKVAKTGKPVILSCGMASLGEIELAVNTVRSMGNNQIILLKCTSSYPAQPKEANLKTIAHLRQAFHTEVGLSDHTLGLGVPIAAVALGACLIEKHMILSREEPALDRAFSLEPQEWESLVREAHNAWEALGQVQYRGTQEEQAQKAYRRSLYVSQDISRGEVLTNENVRIVRPGHGLSPSFLEVVLGRPAQKDIKAGTALTWDMV